MTEKQYVAIGRTGKTHGIGGEMKVAVEPHFLEDFLKAETVFLEVRGKKVPYFVESIRGENPIVKFEEVDSREAALLLTAKEIFLREKDILAEEEREIPVDADGGFGFCKNYLMSDDQVGEVGRITEVLELPQGPMAVVMFNNREVYVPLVEQFVKKIDKRSRKILMDLPAGLLDL